MNLEKYQCTSTINNSDKILKVSVRISSRAERAKICWAHSAECGQWV